MTSTKQHNFQVAPNYCPSQPPPANADVAVFCTFLMGSLLVTVLFLKSIFAALQASCFQVALQLSVVLNMKTMADSHTHFNQAG
ncbi:hypothetical protein [Eikenella halliae]|uniref:hypothetical protein n=1 Tax=Eikenella halliae TaxID=1795832 RepID=UPI000A67149F|nr:hypothetical protein [Eikenella halliae]